MAISNIASALNSKLRMSGMVSGLDTDTIIKQLMAAETAKLDKLRQKRELSVWKTDAYRDITSTLKSFYSEYFDTVSSKNLKSANSFSSFSSTFVDTAKSEYIGINPGAGATAGTYSITDIKAATTAGIYSSVNVSKVVATGTLTDSDVQQINSADFNNQFVFTLNNKTVELNLKDGLTTVSQLRQELQDKIDGAFGAGKVTVTNNAGKLEFTSKSTDVFSIGTATNMGAGVLFGAMPTAATPFTLNAGNNKFEFTIDGVRKTVTVPPVDASGNPMSVFEDPADLAAAIQKGVENAFGSTTGVTFEAKDGKVVSKVSDKQVVAVGYSLNEYTNTLLKVDKSNLSNKINLSAKLKDIMPGLNTALPVGDITGTISGDADNDIEFTINGKAFRFNSSTQSMNDIMSKVNSDTSVNVSMKYDVTTNSFKITSRNTGVTAKVDIADSTGKFMEVLGLTGTSTGTDASLKINGMEEIVRPDNSFTYAGIAFELKKDYSSSTEPIVIKVAGDTTKTYDFIKGFVDKYNEVIDKLNSTISEKRYSDYLPLTEDQKSAMSEEQIKKWETYAKSGLLKDDSIISATLSKFRKALYDSVAGVGVNLSSIGITTSSDYLDKGKLVINETKLKDALANKPEEVMNLFIKNSDITYYNAINGSSADLSQRYKDSGLAQRLSDAIQDAVRTSLDKNGLKGSLLEKAGVVGDRSEYTNLLYKEITAFDKSVVEMNSKLTDKENALYKKFSAMETALSKMNSQSSWIAQQFGGNNQ